jgi:integrase/recombinase XerD
MTTPTLAIDDRDPFKVRNIGDWQQLPNDCAGAQISNESLVRDFVRGSETIGSATQEKYAQHLYEFAEWLAEERGVSLLKARRPDVKRFMTYLKGSARMERDAQRPSPCGWKGALAPSTRKSFLAAIRELWRYCNQMEYTELDPTMGIETPKVEHVPGLTLTREEIRRFLDAPGSERDRVQAYLLVYTAARSSAIRFLRWEDVDFGTEEIRVRSKGGKTTAIPMHPQLKAALLRWRGAQRREAEVRAADGKTGMADALEDPDTAYVLLTRTGLPLAHSTVAKQVKWRAARAGLVRHGAKALVGGENKSKLHPHALRRSWASIALNAGAALEDIADMLQHASIDTTRKHYAFTSSERKRRIAHSFNV